MKTSRLFLLASALFCLIACSDDTTQLRALDKSAKVLAFGDSLTYGTGAQSSESYPAVLEHLIGRKVINAGVAGEISETGKKRLKSILIEHQPALVILCHGGNDLLQKRDNSETTVNLKAMIKMSRDSGADVVLLSVPKPGLLLSPAPFYEMIADETNTPVLIGLMSDILTDRALKSDTAHPNAKGYQKMATTIQTFLQEKGAISNP